MKEVSEVPIKIMFLFNHPDYKPGWYYANEAEQLVGPFSTFEKAEFSFRQFVKELG